MKRSSRLIGKEYGFLEVISMSKYKLGEVRKARCVCVCGNEVTRSAAYLRSKTALIKSCGCSNIRAGEQVKDSTDGKVNEMMQRFYLGKGAI